MHPIEIRLLKKEDINQLRQHFCFAWSSFEETEQKWEKYYQEHFTKQRIVFIIILNKEIVGYASLLPTSQYSFFKQKVIMEAIMIKKLFQKL